jgi:hypothetical protein
MNINNDYEKLKIEQNDRFKKVKVDSTEEPNRLHPIPLDPIPLDHIPLVGPLGPIPLVGPLLVVPDPVDLVLILNGEDVDKGDVGESNI